jgi:succinoglycan biosynthesis transport protein ExoP
MSEPLQISLFGMSFNHAIWTIWRRKWVIALFTLFGLAAAQLFISFIPPKYVASSQIIFDTSAEQLVTSDQELRTSFGVYQIFQSATALINSPGILEPVAHKIMSKSAGGLSSEPTIQKILTNPDLSNEERTAILIDMLEKGLTIKTLAANQIIVLEYRSGSPTEAAFVANLIATTFLEQRAASREASLAQATKWLDQRSFEAKGRLIAADKKIQDFKAEHHIEDETGSSAVEKELTRARDQLSTVQTQLSENRAVYETLATYARSDTKDYERLSEHIGGTALERLRSSLTDAQSSLASTKAKLGSSHPDVKAQKSRVKTIKNEIAAEAHRKQLSTKTEIEQLASREQALRHNIKNLESKVHELRTSEVQLLELKREREATKTLYESMLSKVMQANLQQTLNFAQFRILLDATVPKRPKRPPALFWAGGLIMGFAFGLFVSLGWELLWSPLVVLDQRTRQLPVKFIIQAPLITEKDFDGTQVKRSSHYRNFAKEFPKSLFTNKLLVPQLAANAIKADGGGKIIMITSPRQGSGKTHISSNLASLSVLLGKKSLLLDIDARKYDQCKEEIDAPSCFGEGALLTATDLQEVFTATRAEIGGYDVLRIRASNEAACLHFQTQTEALLKFARQNYDHVWIDTPPAGIFNDPLVLASQVDGVIIVAEWSKTTMRQLKDTLNLIQDSGGSALGVIINKIPVNALISETMASYADYYNHPAKQT